MDTELPNITREWIDKVFHVQPGQLEELTLASYRYQYQTNKIYAAFADAVGRSPEKVASMEQIPFLPIRFFKTHEVTSGTFLPGQVFESSGTTGQLSSRHLVRDPELYQKSFLGAFRKFYGDPHQWCILGLLPSYLERKQSSLVVMATELIAQSGHPDSGFYLYDHASLEKTLLKLESQGQQTLLLGVSFALLDFADSHPLQLKYTTVMETGGMKGRREEWTRQQVHDYLQAQWGVRTIHSEYGMTELLSQAYSAGQGIFHSPPWMKVLVREEDDPLQLQKSGSGAINIIDLANIHSCCFIATDDVGRLEPDGSFEIMGRLDNADLRGCSLMVA